MTGSILRRAAASLAALAVIGSLSACSPFSEPSSSPMSTTAEKNGDGYVLTGEKKWIGNAAFADLTIVWAQDDQTGQVSGFVVEKGTPGFETTVLEGKIARRTVQNAQIRLENCRVPMANKLKAQINRLITQREMLVDGLVGIANGDNPRIIESRLRGYIF